MQALQEGEPLCIALFSLGNRIYMFIGISCWRLCIRVCHALDLGPTMICPTSVTCALDLEILQIARSESLGVVLEFLQRRMRIMNLTILTICLPSAER